MSSVYIPVALRRAVGIRSRHRCCYCLTPEWIGGADFTIDHIAPLSMGGETIFDNLCLACWACNPTKNDRFTAVDPDTGAIERLFHPVHQRWTEHFQWQENGLLIIGVTPTGRTTVAALKLNRLLLVNARRLWINAGWHPPTEE